MLLDDYRLALVDGTVLLRAAYDLSDSPEWDSAPAGACLQRADDEGHWHTYLRKSAGGI